MARRREAILAAVIGIASSRGRATLARLIGAPAGPLALAAQIAAGDCKHGLALFFEDLAARRRDARAQLVGLHLYARDRSGFPGSLFFARNVKLLFPQQW